MSVSIELEFASFAEAGHARVFLENRAELLRAAGIALAQFDIRPVLGASRTVFALRVALHVLTDVAIGVAGNAVYDQLKTAITEIEATKSVPPALTIRINDQPMVLEQQPFLQAFEAAHAPVAHRAKAQI